MQTIQIAGLQYQISGQNDFDLNEEERQFLLTTENQECFPAPLVVVRTRIQGAEKLPYPVAPADYEERDLRVRCEGESEIRTYYAGIYEHCPVYAQSRFNCGKEKQLDIYYLGKSGLWGNCNLRIWNHLHLEPALLSVGALVLHCSYLMYQDQAILFSAPSGTGKTTQAKLWEKYYGGRIINGDKAVLMKRDGRWFVWGFPYHGSAPECENQSYPIRAISVVRQSPVDYIEEERTGKAIRDLYSEITVNSWKEEEVSKALELVGDICMSLPVVRQYCTMKKEAADTLYRYLF